MRLNVPKHTPPVYTHEGARASNINAEQMLRRSVMANMLWEDEFYEDGKSNAARIAELIPQVSPSKVAAIAVEAREQMKLRHLPLLLARELARGTADARLVVADTLERIIQRPDELTEFLAIYWKEKRQPLSAQVKKGLARAFGKFNEYSLAKYNRDGAVKLRDVLFLSHAKPTTPEQTALFKRVVDNQLAVPDTWEVALSAGQDKKSSWERLIAEKKLGGLAVLRNLRNMVDAGVDRATIAGAIDTMKVDRVLPFRFIAAARYAGWAEPHLEAAMLRSLTNAEFLPQRTVLLVDVSGSMDAAISTKSEMQRIDAAMGLAVLLREVCEDVDVFSFSDRLVEIPKRRGFALRDAITSSQPHSGTALGNALTSLTRRYDRIIVITDEQSSDSVPTPKVKGYIINVASYQNGVGYGPWTHIDGWSEAVIDYIRESEKVENSPQVVGI